MAQPTDCPVPHSPTEPSSCCGLNTCSAYVWECRTHNLVGSQFEGSSLISTEISVYRHTGLTSQPVPYLSSIKVYSEIRAMAFPNFSRWSTNYRWALMKIA